MTKPPTQHRRSPSDELPIRLENAFPHALLAERQPGNTGLENRPLPPCLRRQLSACRWSKARRSPDVTPISSLAASPGWLHTRTRTVAGRHRKHQQHFDDNALSSCRVPADSADRYAYCPERASTSGHAGKSAAERAEAIRARYGGNARLRCRSSQLALAGLVSWRVSSLPFELACFPQSNQLFPPARRQLCVAGLDCH